MKAEIKQALDDLAELTRHEVHDGSVAAIRAHIEEQGAEIERQKKGLSDLRHRLRTIDRNTSDLIDDVVRPLKLAIYRGEPWFSAKGETQRSLDASVKNMADEVQRLRSDLAAIRALLSEALGVDGSAAELAKAASAVIGSVVSDRQCQMPAIVSIRAAVEAAKGGSDVA